MVATTWDPMMNPIVSNTGLAVGAYNEVLQEISDLLDAGVPFVGGFFGNVLRSAQLDEPSGVLNGPPDNGPALGHVSVMMFGAAIGELGIVGELSEALTSLRGLHRHHIFPQGAEFAPYWERAGIDIDQFCVPVSEREHLGQIHGPGSAALPAIADVKKGGLWNECWRQFFKPFKDAGIYPTRSQIEQEAKFLMEGFGLGSPKAFVPGSPDFVPYVRRRSW
jgi:hypothetical protein